MRSGDVRAVAAVAALLVLAACGGDERAGTLPSPSPTVTTTPTTPTVAPSADYEAEVRRAIDAYFAALYAAGLDPANKTDDLAELLSPACTCRDVVRVLRQEAQQGRYIDYRYTLRDVRVVAAGPLGANVTYTVHQSEGAERDRSGRVITRYKATVTKYSARFVRVDGVWLLDRVEEHR